MGTQVKRMAAMKSRKQGADFRTLGAKIKFLFKWDSLTPCITTWENATVRYADKWEHTYLETYESVPLE